MVPNGLAGINRLQMVSSDLADGNEYTCLAPISAAIGQLQIDVMEIQETAP
jgi:hypothetical protein